MTSSCERKPSKEQGGKKDLFWEGGRRGRERRQRREAKKTGGMEKEGQRGSINRERPRDRRDRARKGLHFVPKHGRQGALPIPFLQSHRVHSRAHVCPVPNQTEVQSQVDLTSGSPLSPRKGKPVFHFD